MNLASSTDRELLGAAQRGDAEAFGVIVERYRPLVVGFLIKRTANLEDAEDLAQDTFTVAFRKLHLYDASRPFRSWVFSIAARQAIDRRRAEKLHNPACHTDPVVLNYSLATELDPASHDVVEKVRDVLEVMEDRRSASLLSRFYFDGLTSLQLAVELGVFPATVRFRLTGARRKFAAEWSTRHADRVMLPTPARGRPRGSSIMVAGN